MKRKEQVMLSQGSVFAAMLEPSQEELMQAEPEEEQEVEDDPPVN